MFCAPNGAAAVAAALAVPLVFQHHRVLALQRLGDHRLDVDPAVAAPQRAPPELREFGAAPEPRQGQLVKEFLGELEVVDHHQFLVALDEGPLVGQDAHVEGRPDPRGRGVTLLLHHALSQRRDGRVLGRGRHDLLGTRRHFGHQDGPPGRFRRAGAGFPAELRREGPRLRHVQRGLLGLRERAGRHVEEFRHEGRPRLVLGGGAAPRRGLRLR